MAQPAVLGALAVGSVAGAFLVPRLTAGKVNLKDYIGIFGVIVEPTPFEELPVELTAEWQLVDLTAGARDYETTVTLPPGNETATVAFSGEGLNRLRIGLTQSGLDPKYFAWPPEHDPERAPYRGLLPLEAEDAGIFFGREGPIVAGIDMLRGLGNAPPPRLLVILGATDESSTIYTVSFAPMFAQEMVMAVWLIAKGFSSSAAPASNLRNATQ